MDENILFWLGLLGLYLFRQIVARKRQPQHKKVGSPKPADVDASREQPSQAPVISEFDQALTELKRSIGIESPAKPVHDVEAFGTSEEQFEAEKPYRDYSSSSEEKFERRPESFVPKSDSEDAFEKEDGFSKSAVFYDDGFDETGRSSEVSFRDAWKGHESDYEYHSALERPKASILAAKPKPESAKRESRLRRRIRRSSDLQMAVLMHEVLAEPVSVRARSARRRPS